MKIKQLPFLILLLIPLSCGGGGGGGSPSGSSSAITLDLTGVYIPPDCVGKTITVYPTTADIPAPPSETNSTISTTVQLQVFDAATNLVSIVYLYPDFNGLDWPGTVATYRAQVAAGLETEAFYTKMSDLITALGDEHSQFQSPVVVAASDAELAGNNSYVGMGVLVKPMIDKGKLTILAVFGESAAEHGGLAPHDSLLAINGIPLVANGKSYNSLVRGPECSGAVLTVQTPGQPERKITLVRYLVTGPLPIYERLVDTTDGSRIGYIFIPTFFDDTIPDQVKNALEALDPLDGLIIDNRMNPGGSSTVIDPIMGYFTSGHVGDFVSRNTTRAYNITAGPVNNSDTVPLIVLVGTDTVSFGEISSGILQDIGRAKIVGQTTLGNVETLHGYNFTDGSRLWIAEERFDPIVSHAFWEQTGIIPDVEAHADWDTFTFDNDPSVNAAVTLLGH